MPDRIRFMMLGGFLGAGKTTAISRLAQQLQAAGKHVCIVTNDQAADLVDTQLLRSMGYRVAEVAGSCFCCNFNGLTEAMDQLGRQQRPDVILAEPVGSCTDLIATVALPMMERLGEEFEISPYAVILKPSHGLKILAREGQGFSPQAEYIFRKQLEEADILLINRIDELPPETVDKIDRLLGEQFPGREVLRISAKTGENLDRLIRQLHEPARRPRQLMEVDYDVYAEGEADLGWLNASVTVQSSPSAFGLDRLVLDIVAALKDKFRAEGVEPAHLKVIGQADGRASVANLVSSDSPAVLSLSGGGTTDKVDLIVNARVATDPESLRSAVVSALTEVATSCGACATIHSIQSFRPGRPVPTYRVTH